jgi:Zn-dependent protease
MDFSTKNLAVLAGVVALILLNGAFHAASEALAARLLGDDRPEIRSRISLNPLRHGGFFSTLILPLATYLLIGWPLGGPGSPAADEERLGPRRMALVAVAGVLGNALCAVAIAFLGAACIAAGWIDDVDRLRSPAYKVCTVGMFYAVFSMLMHLVPIPPAGGSRIVGAFLPGPLRRAYFALAPVGGILILVFMLWATGFLSQYVPSLGVGYARELRQFQSWSYEQMDRLADYFGG